jgi:uncharacterized protein YecE (DUF72 family)
MKRKASIHIGTSGWQYDHWKGPFYPEGLSNRDLLPYYAERFHTVEINNSFYRLPEAKTFKAWHDATPAGFIFTVKASRYITHMKKLKDPKQPTSTLLERAGTLGEMLGPILFQLPPRWHFNLGRLESFLESLPRDNRYAFEFRDPTWFDSRTYQALEAQGAAFCIYELAGRLSPKEVTAGFVYIRLHGPKGAYQGQYDTSVLSGWAGAISTWVRQGKEVFCYFDNDEAGYAAQDALRLQEMVGG